MDSDHMDSGHGAWWWVLGVVGLIIVMALSLVVVMLLLQRSTRPHATSIPPGNLPAEDLLATRLARGEIDVDEYQHRRAALRE